MTEERSSGDDDGLSWDSRGSRDEMAPLSLNEVHSLLASDRRRAVLSYLRERPGRSVQLDALVDACLRTEGREPTDEQRLYVEADLHHSHLPALDAAGVARYDTNDGTVTYRPSEQLEAYLVASDAIEATDRDAE